jgi:hypothetical protein
MIGFNYLGKQGRLANQMFQYSALKGIARKHGYTWCIPPSNFSNPYYEHQLFEIFNLPSLTNISYLPQDFPIIQERGFEFDEKLFETCPDNINLYGYFQTEKYFKHIENEIREDFSFKDEIIDPCKKMIDELGDCISLHVRRTDYVSNCIEHPPLSLDYYSQALNYFDENARVIIFSDDVDWCKAQEIFKSDRFLISESKNNAIDLCLMTLCNGHIIANSSYSWWGCWLSNSIVKIAPTKWFGTTGDTAKNNTKDLIPSDWIVI